VITQRALAEKTPDFLGLAATVLISGARVLKVPPYVGCSVSSG
jgi:hypothetical protein